MKINLKGITAGTWIRTIVLVLAIVNQVLVAFGKSPLPFEHEEADMLVSSIFTGVAGLWAWWGNNSVTIDAQMADRYLGELIEQHKQEEEGEG